MQYRRARITGGTYFFTVVSFRRARIFIEEENIALLREAFRTVMKRHPFFIEAFVLLPDHMHCIWTLPSGDADFSKRWRLIKSYFSRKCDDRYRQRPFSSRIAKKEQAIWQRRFWEHWIQDEHDFINHVEYIHYNPVKHGLVDRPIDWPYSSLHSHIKQGKSDPNWGSLQGFKQSEIAGWIE